MKEHSIEQFVQELASAHPTPGGGSVAALGGALAGALGCMVANLRLSKDTNPAVLAARDAFVGLYEACLTDIQRDMAAYQAVVVARQLPKGTDEEKAARTAALQDSLKRAAEVPLETAIRVVDILQQAQQLEPHAAKSYVSDLAVANFFARAALRSAALNVEVNLQLIKDAAFVQDMGARVKHLEADGQRHAQALETAIQGRA